MPICAQSISVRIPEKGLTDFGLREKERLKLEKEPNSLEVEGLRCTSRTAATLIK